MILLALPACAAGPVGRENFYPVGCVVCWPADGMALAVAVPYLVLFFF